MSERSARWAPHHIGLLASDPHAIAAAGGQHDDPPWAHGEADPELHTVVIDGIEREPTLDVTRIFVVAPWPIGLGERYTSTFRARMHNCQAATAPPPSRSPDQNAPPSLFLPWRLARVWGGQKRC